ncbi:MAG: hypothetical protein U0996_07360 [Planctomycetaceae bacterium]
MNARVEIDQFVCHAIRMSLQVEQKIPATSGMMCRREQFSESTPERKTNLIFCCGVVRTATL